MKITIHLFAVAAFILPGHLIAESPFPDTGVKKGIVCLLGLPQDDPKLAVEFARGTEFQIFFQSDDIAEVKAVKTEAEKAGLLGSRIFAGTGSINSLNLADNIADPHTVSVDDYIGYFAIEGIPCRHQFLEPCARVIRLQ